MKIIGRNNRSIVNLKNGKNDCKPAGKPAGLFL